MKKLPALLIVGSMLICGSVAQAQVINEEYADALIYQWTGPKGSTCDEVLEQVKALDAAQQLKLREVLHAQLSSDEKMPEGKSALDYRFADKLINQIDDWHGNLKYDEVIEAKLVEPVSQGAAVWYKVETLDGRVYDKLWIGVSTLQPCDTLEDIDVPYRMYLRGKQIVKLEELD